MLDFILQNKTSDKTFTPEFFEKVLNTAIIELNIDKEKIETSLNLVEEAEIKELNNKYRAKDKVTDVLSFPIEEKPLKSGIWPLGDIFICVSFAKNEAKRENISIEDKLAQLTVHGFLHLLGYDHEKSEDAEKMLSLEDKILTRLN